MLEVLALSTSANGSACLIASVFILFPCLWLSLPSITCVNALFQGNGYSAPNGGASATVTPFSRYCASSVVFTGTESYKTTSTSSNFYPSSNGFSFVALYKQSSTSSYTIAAQSRSMFSISVGTSASVGVGYGGTTASYTTSDTSSLHVRAVSLLPDNCIAVKACLFFPSSRRCWVVHFLRGQAGAKSRATLTTT